MSELIPILARENETLVLRSGYRATIRRITAEARPLLAAAIARLSLDSSRRRFFTPRVRLSESELDYLTSADGVDHVALGVCGRAPDGSVEGIASGRYVRSKTDPRMAEIALTVIDPFQRMGLGAALLARLAGAALAGGIERLRGHVLPDNTPMLALFRKHVPAVRYTFDGQVLTADIALAQFRSALPRAA